MVKSLRTALREKLKPSLARARRVAVLGIGSGLRGDDGAGIFAAAELKRMLARRKGRVPLGIFFGETAPENLTGEIKRFKPSHIIMIDTADFDERPGTVVILDPMDIGGGVSFSTHKMPAKVLVDYLQKSLQCEVVFIGIQPKTVDFGKTMSKAVSAAAGEVAFAICSLVTGR